MTTDGKYLKLADLKQYAFDSQSALSNNDTLLTQCIYRAEAIVDSYCGTGWDEQTYVLVQPSTVFVDRNGWLNLIANERGPVTAVTAIQMRNLSIGDTSWKTVTWATDDLIYPVATDPPKPDCWRVIVKPSSPLLSPISTGDILARWSYKGGFSTIPLSLQGIVARLAWWVQKLRDMPAGKVVTAELGLMEIPLSIPPDIKADLNMWRKVIS